MRFRTLSPSVLFLVFCIALVPSHGRAYVTILLYHRFDGTSFPSTNTSSSDFAAQMEYLQKNHYRVLSMDELAGCIEGKIPMPERGAVITMDDGYLSEYTKAVPIVRRYRYPFCIFVYTQAVGSKNYMSYNQLKQIRSWGGVVGCHTRTHPYLTELPPDKIRSEIKGSKEILERNLGYPVQYFAYPFGHYDAGVRAIAREAGFRLMLTSDPGSVGARVEYDRVPRQAIVGSNIGMKEFALKLEKPPLEILESIPASGWQPSRTLTRISIRIKDPGYYLPAHVSMFLSEKGRLNTQYDPRTGVISCNESVRLTREMNRIIVTARRPDGQYAMDSYLILAQMK